MAYEDTDYGVPEPEYGQVQQPFAPETTAPDDINALGAGSDPFAYTKGSLLTPWEKTFNYGGGQAPAGGYYSGTGGYSPMAPLQFSDFAYSFKQPDAFTQTGQFTPSQGKFTYDKSQLNTDFKSSVPAFDGPSYVQPGAFVAPEVTDDPGYKFRLAQGLQALQNSAAAKGILRTGGTYKGLEDYSQQLASQEYQAAYNRAFENYSKQAELGISAYDRQYQEAKDENILGYERQASEYDRSHQNALQRYQMAASEYDRTFQNEFNVNQANFGNALNAWKSNADVNLQGQGLGFQIGSGVWDRNYNKAQTAYQMAVQQAETAAQIASAEAAAAAGAAQWGDSTNYNRALQAYNMDYEQFNNNQTNQFNRLYAMDQQGIAAIAALTGLGSNYANNAGNTAMAGANATAAGQVGSANAYNQALGNLGNYAQQAAMWGALGKPTTLTSGQPKP